MGLVVPSFSLDEIDEFDPAIVTMMYGGFGDWGVESRVVIGYWLVVVGSGI